MSSLVRRITTRIVATLASAGICLGVAVQIVQAEQIDRSARLSGDSGVAASLAPRWKVPSSPVSLLGASGADGTLPQGPSQVDQISGATSSKSERIKEEPSLLISFIASWGPVLALFAIIVWYVRATLGKNSILERQTQILERIATALERSETNRRPPNDGA